MVLASDSHFSSVWDLAVIGAFWKATKYAEHFLTASNIPNPYLLSLANVALWTLYGFAAGLFATGIWVIAHECGHQAFSESKAINNGVGWVLHSACVLNFLSFSHRTCLLN